MRRTLALATTTRWALGKGRLPAPPRRTLSLASLGLESSRAHRLVARRRLRARGGSIDAALLVAASELGPLTDVPYVTYDDITVRQAARYPAWAFSDLPRRDLDGRASIQDSQFRHAQAVCTTTEWAARSVIGDYGVAPAKVRVAGVGGRQRQRPANRAWSEPRFLFVGRDWARKNGELLLRAFDEVRSSCPTATLDLVGGHPPILQEGVRAHGLLMLENEEHQRRLDDLYARATCFVMPSTVEPSGLAVVEAATCALPSIVTSAGGAAEVMSVGGLIVEPGSVDALSSAMLALCDGDVAQRLGELAHQNSARWTWALTAERILTALVAATAPDPQPAGG